MTEERAIKSEPKPHWETYLANTSGELEQETKSRKYNAIEFFGAMILVLSVLWLFAYPLGVLMGIEIVNTISYIILGIAAIWLLVSPLVHKDEFSGWGLGNPKALYTNIKNSKNPKKIALISIVVLLIVGLTAALNIFWVEVAGFLQISENQALEFQQSAIGPVVIIAGGVAVSFLFATVLLRYDNFLSALKTALKVIGVLAALMIVCALLINGLAVFLSFDPASFALNFFGYIFWGAIQQLLFSSYFGTRVRKGFAPAEEPQYVRERRFWISLLNGFFFGLLHIPSWELMLITWLLGVFLSYVFMEDKNRNLIALGVIHGLLGSMLGWLFASPEAEGLNVEMSVGPWSVDYFDPMIFIVVGIIIAGFSAAIIYINEKWDN